MESSDSENSTLRKGVICDYMEQRSILVERVVKLNEAANWNYYEKAMIDLRKEIERIDGHIRALV